MEIRVLLPAGKIPVNSTVCKPTGRAEFVLKDVIRIYNSPEGIPQEIKTDGCLFLVGPRGDINAIGKDTPMMWIVDAEELLEYLKEIYDSEEDK